MGLVGGSRHYDGGGLGEGMAGWICPACGADNTGPLAHGCTSCGAGKPGYRPMEVKMSAPPATAATDTPPPPLHDDDHTYNGDVADRWALRNPSATPAEAYRAGYLDGVHATREALRPSGPRLDRPRETPLAASLEARQLRTLVAALEWFRDRIVAEQPEEITTGEWCSPEELTALIQNLKEQEAVVA